VAFRAFDALPAVTSQRPLSVPSSYDSSSGILPIVADRVALPDNLQHVELLSALPPDVSQLYASPERLLLPTELAASRLATAGLRRPRVLAHRRQYVQLVHRMLRLGMLQFTTAPQCVNGLFGVPKGDDETRLILDARAANCYFVDSPHVQLPSPSHLAQLQVHNGRPFSVAKMDLSNFYHQLVLPSWVRPYFSLPPLSAKEMRSLASSPDLPSSLFSSLVTSSGGPVFPCCVTLPMGFSHSVFLAQCVHEHVVYTYSSLSPRDNLLNLVSPVLAQPVHGLYIDDCVLIGSSRDEVAAQYRTVLEAYKCAGLPVKQSKCTEATSDPVTVLGVDLHGAEGKVALSPERHWKILAATAGLLSRPLVSGRELAQVLGAWTWQLLLRRPVLSALKHCYRYVERSPTSDLRQLWPCAARELCVLVGLSPLLVADLRSAWSPHLVATDSSSLAAGVVTTPLQPSTLHTLWPLGSRHLPSLLPSASPVVRSSVQQARLTNPPAQPMARHSPASVPVALVQSTICSSSWTTLISMPWQKSAHINALELHSVLLALRWSLSRPATVGSRLPFLVDSSVVYYALRKGRSRASSILCLLRRCSALSLGMGCSLFPVWVPSALNPADAPSRSTTASASGKPLPGRPGYG
jgi:hypothetical protein